MNNNNSAQTITVESCGWSQIGTHRTENQDCFLNLAKNRIWAVADGVGGCDQGGYASKLIIQSLMEAEKPSTLDEHINNALRNLQIANFKLIQQSAKAGKIAASTIVAFLIHDNFGACLWAGDSRCYLFRQGVLYQCTRDHTLRQDKINKGELTISEAHRMIRGNIITNAIGVNNDLHLEQVRFSLCSGDRFLLCSDGLERCISTKSLSSFLEIHSLKESVEELAKTINEKKQPDNVTFIAINISHPDDTGALWLW